MHVYVTRLRMFVLKCAFFFVSTATWSTINGYVVCGHDMTRDIYLFDELTRIEGFGQFGSVVLY